MVRLATSDVSALPGFVANGRQACITFPLPSPQFRTVGFPQYGYKPESGRDLRRDGNSRQLIRGPSPLDPPKRPGRLRVRRRRRPMGVSDPEALGSPAGCSVPPGHRLLWPHPRLWASPADFLPRSYTPGLVRLRRRPRASLIYSACPSVRAVFRTPAVGRCSTVPNPPALAFAQSYEARHPQIPRKSRFTRGVNFEAAKFALCYGPDSCSSFTDKDFYFRAFIP